MPTTLRSPLGITFRWFVLTTLTCALTCFWGVRLAWGMRDPAYGLRQYSVMIENGRLSITRRLGNYAWQPTPKMLAGTLGLRIDPVTPIPMGFAGNLWKRMFGISRDETLGPYYVGAAERHTTVTLPLWPVPLLMLLPSLRFAGIKYRERITRRRARRGCCTGCGYDLRASPERCPECGSSALDSKTREQGLIVPRRAA
jgi:hypothetical protein